MRWLLFLLVAVATTMAHAQDYTERWRDLTSGAGGEKLFWEEVETSSADDIYIAGRTSAPALIVKSYTKDGDERWTSRDPGFEPGFSLLDMKLDAASNVYALTLEPNRGIVVTSFSGGNGAFRWRQPLAATLDSRAANSTIEVGTRGNSTFLYVFIQGASSSSIHRLNSGTGAGLFSRSIGGLASAGHIDSNGNLLFVQGGSQFAKVNQSLTPVWSVISELVFATNVLRHPQSGKTVSLSFDNIGDGFFYFLVDRNATNGESIASTFMLSVDEVDVLPGQTRSLAIRPNGGWIVSLGDAIFGFDDQLRMDMDLRSAAVQTLAVDLSGQVHVVPRGIFGVVNAARSTSFETTFGDSQRAIDISTDTANRVIIVGSASNDSFGVVLQLATSFIVGTDVFSRPYVDRLEISAPGVLINDSNANGGTLSIETAPTNGAVELRQDGSFTYTPNVGTSGNDQFRYRVTKNGVSRSATAFVKRVVPVDLQVSAVVGGDPYVPNLTVSTATFTDPFIVDVVASSGPISSTRVLMNSGRSTGSGLGTSQVVSTETTATITTSLAGTTLTRTFAVLPGGMIDIVSKANAPLIQGNPAKLVLQLSGILSQSRTFQVGISSSSTQNLTIPAGASSGEFKVNLPTSTSVLANANFTLLGQRQRIERGFTLVPEPQLASVSLTNSLLYAGVPNALVVTLDSPAGFLTAVVKLFSDNANVVTAPSLKIITNRTTESSFFTPSLAGTNQSVTLTATLNGASKSVTTLIRPNLLQSLSTSTTIVRVGSNLKGTVQLNWIAPVGGQAVAVTSSRPSTVAVPSSVTVAAGLTTKTFSITTNGTLSAATSVTITASIGLVSKTRTISVLP